MKKIIGLNLVVITTLILGSCGSSNNVVSNKLISKRKYNKGFFVNKKAVASTTSKNEIEDKANTERVAEPVTATLDLREVNNPVNANVVRYSADVASAELSTTDTYSDQVANIREDREVSRGTEVGSSELLSAEEIDTELEEKTLNRIERNKKREQEKNSSGSSEDAMFILAVILAILIPPLGVLVYTNIDWMKVLIALVLTLLFFLPGMIYALLVVFDVI